MRLTPASKIMVVEVKDNSTVEALITCVVVGKCFREWVRVVVSDSCILRKIFDSSSMPGKFNKEDEKKVRKMIKEWVG